MSKYDEQLAVARAKLAEYEEALKEMASAAADAEAKYLSAWKRSDQLFKQIEAQFLYELHDYESKEPRSFLSTFQKMVEPTSLKERALSHPDRIEHANRMQAASSVLERKNSLVASVSRIKDQISLLESRISADGQKEAKKAIALLRKENRQQLVRAKAAAHDRSSRDLASQVKKRLEQQDCCPYCGGKLGADKHADHIYPVSKGGLSTVRNLVFACGPCNARKRDMTLSAFIKACNLSRDEIEWRLTELGKDI